MNQAISDYVTGEEVILAISRCFYKNLSLDDPLRYSMYRKIYQNLIDNNTSLPFSRADKINPVAADLDVSKGVLVVHSKGVGVSTLLQTLQRMFRNMPHKFTRITIFEIAKLLRNKQHGMRDLFDQYGYGLRQHLVIDDCILGLMGDYTVDFLREFINERLMLHVNRGFKTHFAFEYTTTWKDAESQVKDMLINVYGLEAYKQLMEMNNLVVWQGEPFEDTLPDFAPRFNTYLKERPDTQ